jgi:hypothetical protein
MGNLCTQMCFLSVNGFLIPMCYMPNRAKLPLSVYSPSAAFLMHFVYSPFNHLFRSDILISILDKPWSG